jgi:hypothetical protein
VHGNLGKASRDEVICWFLAAVHLQRIRGDHDDSDIRTTSNSTAGSRARARRPQ